MPLSLRLQTILNQALSGGDFWDLCCDHGLLGEHALYSKRFQKIHFVDQVPKIIDSLENRLKFYARNCSIHFHCMDASKIKKASGAIVIAGVGDKTMVQIIEGILPSLQLPFSLTLCPHKNPHRVREYLIEKGFFLEQEEVVLERGHFREVLTVSKTPNKRSFDLLGVSLWAQGDGPKEQYAQHLWDHFTHLHPKSEDFHMGKKIRNHPSIRSLLGQK